jgi:DNA-binding transcriptional ArsR family regulator
MRYATTLMEQSPHLRQPDCRTDSLQIRLRKPINSALVALQVLGEPRRLQILDLLRDGELPVGELVDRLDLSQPAVSKHLRALKDAGLVEVRPDAQRRLYSIRPEPLAQLDDWLASYRQLWTTHLDLARRRKR